MIKKILNRLLFFRTKILNKIYLINKSRINKKTLDKIYLSNKSRINKWGYRDYVGGVDPETWYGIGKLQFHFLIKEGLKHEHNFLDIACGSLRLGQYLIPYLDKKKYHGIDGEKILISQGLKKEILFNINKLKECNFVINYNFDFSFCKTYDFAIAQSLFTHLTLKDINLCFKNLYKISKKNSRFYFTFFNEHNNPHGDVNTNQNQSHPNHVWVYDFKTLEKIARANGFKCIYIGDWGHPRNQKIALATPMK